MAVESLRFTKMHGAGNDFILADGRQVSPELRSGLSAALCRRRLSIGGDGLIFVTRTSDNETDVDFYNPDGSQAEMCGNGSRCAARFAVEELHVAPEHRMATVSGVLDAVYSGPESVSVVMPQPANLALNRIEVNGVIVHDVQVGVPHTVVVADDIADWDDERLRMFGRRLRYDSNLYPSGTNLNVTAPADGGRWRVRTYERGVEDITLACGTGNTATAIVLEALGRASLPFRSIVDGGRLAIEQVDGRYRLVGPARTVMTGTFCGEALSVD